jgi:hypothetical protein
MGASGSKPASQRQKSTPAYKRAVAAGERDYRERLREKASCPRGYAYEGPDGGGDGDSPRPARCARYAPAPRFRPPLAAPRALTANEYRYFDRPAWDPTLPRIYQLTLEQQARQDGWLAGALRQKALRERAYSS